MLSIDRLCEDFPEYADEFRKVWNDGVKMEYYREDEDTPAAAIQGAFMWSHTPQGHQYWQGVYDTLVKKGVK